MTPRPFLSIRPCRKHTSGRISRLSASQAGKPALLFGQPPEPNCVAIPNATGSVSDFVLRAASGKWRSPFAPETIIFSGPVETIFAGERRSSMPARFVDLDRQTPMFLPYDLREWVPACHIVHCYAQVRPKWRQPFDEEHGGRSPTGS